VGEYNVNILSQNQKKQQANCFKAIHVLLLTLVIMGDDLRLDPMPTGDPSVNGI